MKMGFATTDFCLESLFGDIPTFTHFDACVKQNALRSHKGLFPANVYTDECGPLDLQRGTDH
jgi:hypothetical protein